MYMKLKKQLIQHLLQHLDERFNILQASALEAKDAATNEESKAENKYDTRGLEASYLAGAQAKRAKDLQDAIYIFSKIQDEELSDKETVEMYSVVNTELEAENENEDLESEVQQKNFFIVPSQGGVELKVDGTTYLTLTISSPLGEALHKKSNGEEVVIKIGERSNFYSLFSIV